MNRNHDWVWTIANHCLWKTTRTPRECNICFYEVNVFTRNRKIVRYSSIEPTSSLFWPDTFRKLEHGLSLFSNDHGPLISVRLQIPHPNLLWAFFRPVSIQYEQARGYWIVGCPIWLLLFGSRFCSENCVCESVSVDGWTESDKSIGKREGPPGAIMFRSLMASIAWQLFPFNFLFNLAHPGDSSVWLVTTRAMKALETRTKTIRSRNQTLFKSRSISKRASQFY